MLPFQLDSPLCVGNAGVKCIEGSCPSKLTRPLVSHPRVKFREGSCPSKLTHPVVSHPGVKFREGRCHSNWTHPFMWAMQGQNLDQEMAVPTFLTLLWAMQG